MRKVPVRLRGTNFCTSSARVAPSFVRQPNGLECTQIVGNEPKRRLRVQWCASGAFLAKNHDATSWHELLHSFGPFCIEFRKATKRSRCNQIVQNEPKHQFRVQWGGSGAFVAKKFQCYFMAQTFAIIALVQPVLHRVSCSNETIQNAPKYYRTHQNMS